MKILIISPFFPPENSVAALRPHSWAKYWSRAGEEVTVLTTPKLEKKGVSLSLSNPGYTLIEVPLSQKGSIGYTLFQYLPFVDKLKKTKGIFSSCRMPDQYDLWVKPALDRIRREGPWDVVVSTSGPYSTHVIANRLKKEGLTRKWVADFRDLWSDHSIFPGLFPFSFFEKYWEKELLSIADRIITINESQAEILTKKHGKDKVFIVENGGDPEDLSALPSIPIFLDDQKFRMVYTGSLCTDKHDLTPLLEAIKEIEKSPETRPLLDALEVIFVGPEQESLNSLIKKYQVSLWIKTLGFVDREVALRMQRDAHKLLFFPSHEPSGKDFEYLFSNTPILSIGRMGTQEIGKVYSDAEVAESLETKESIQRRLIELLKDKNKRKITPPRKYIEKYHRKNLAEKFLLFCR